MALFCRARQTKLNHLCSLFKRSYLQVSGPRLSDHAARHKLLGSVNHHLSHDLLVRPIKAFNSVRSFAAPVQVKKEEKSSKPRMNKEIKSDMIRLVTDEGHDIISLDEAMQRAKSLNLDLVEVDRSSKPIVCKIMDYNKERYVQHLKEKERAKSKADTTMRKGGSKEIRYAPKIEQKDLQTKAQMAKKLMAQGYRVKCMVTGSEADDLKGSIARILPMIEDVALVEQGPTVERSQAYVVVRHMKFGPPKKGGKSVAKFVGETSSAPQKGTPSQPKEPENSGPEKHHNDTLPDADFDQPTENPPENRYIRQPGSVPQAQKSPKFTGPAENGYSRQPGSVPQMPQSPKSTGPAENRYIRQPGSVPQMPQSPQFPGPTENRYNRQPGSVPQMPQSPKFPGPAENRYNRQPGSVPQMPQSPTFTGPAENRYSRQPQAGSTRRGPPGTGGDPRPTPPRGDIPKQRPSSDDVSTPKSYGIFSK